VVEKVNEYDEDEAERVIAAHPYWLRDRVYGYRGTTGPRSDFLLYSVPFFDPAIDEVIVEDADVSGLDDGQVYVHDSQAYRLTRADG